MKTSQIIVLLLCAFCALPVPCQDKVAEAEYQRRGVSKDGTALSKTATRWVLYAARSGGYHLNSEIQNLPVGLRIVQVEELNERLAPTAIGYELYKNDEKEPSITVDCKIAREAITCSGTFEKKQVPNSAPYKQEGPFWLWMEGLFALDMPWLLDGSVNSAHLEKGAAKVPTVNVLGGTAVLIGDAVNVAKLKAIKGLSEKIVVVAPDKPVEWQLYSDEKSLLEQIDTGAVDVGAAKVVAKHYTYKNGDKPMHLWMSESGILMKLTGENDGVDFVLANYKQYKKLIQELPVEPPPEKSEPQKSK